MVSKCQGGKILIMLWVHIRSLGYHIMACWQLHDILSTLPALRTGQPKSHTDVHAFLLLSIP